jgi:hypothetical protein
MWTKADVFSTGKAEWPVHLQAHLLFSMLAGFAFRWLGMYFSTVWVSSSYPSSEPISKTNQTQKQHDFTSLSSTHTHIETKLFLTRFVRQNLIEQASRRLIAWKGTGEIA